jgi:hypothetical protein
MTRISLLAYRFYGRKKRTARIEREEDDNQEEEEEEKIIIRVESDRDKLKSSRISLDEH